MKYFITGGTGFLADALIRELIKDNNEIIVFSRDEYKQYIMRKQYPDLTYIIGDVSDPISYDGPIDYIIHTAALKHVSSCDDFKRLALKTNIIGTLNVCEFAKQKNVKNLLFASTDKAVNPISFYGYTKQVAESFILDYNYTVFRFGNLFGSTGSVVPYFLDVAESGKPFELSHADSERYFITSENAAKMILRNKDRRGNIIFEKYNKLKIIDLIFAIKENPNIKIVGLRPYEKLSENLEESIDASADYYTVDEIKSMIEQYKQVRRKLY